MGVPAQRAGEIPAGRRAIPADTDLRLCRSFGLPDGWWLRLRPDYDATGAVLQHLLIGTGKGRWRVFAGGDLGKGCGRSFRKKEIRTSPGRICRPATA